MKTGLKGVVTENWGLKVVSLLIASLLWLLVVSENQSEEHFKASLSLVNIPEELVITGGVPQYINVRIVGPRTIVSNVRQRKLGVTLDLGGMQSGTSTYEILPKRFGLPHGVEAWSEPWGMGCVGGSMVLVIDPSHFGPISEVKDRSDRFARAVKSANKRPGVEEIHLPGERGYRAWKANKPVEILDTHWDPFVARAKKYGVDVEGLRNQWNETH